MNMFDIILKLSYGVMIAAIILCFLLMKRQQRNLRLAVNRFAFAFVQLSNHIAPTPPRDRLRGAADGKGDFHALPAQEQPECLGAVIARAGDEQAVAFYGEMTDALEDVRRLCGRNKKLARQFFDPIEELFGVARIFLVGCEGLVNINSEIRLEKFNRFLFDQVSHRKMLLRRISGDAGPEYATYNTHYDLRSEEK